MVTVSFEALWHNFHTFYGLLTYLGSRYTVTLIKMTYWPLQFHFRKKSTKNFLSKLLYKHMKNRSRYGNKGTYTTFSNFISIFRNILYTKIILTSFFRSYHANFYFITIILVSWLNLHLNKMREKTLFVCFQSHKNK